MTAPASRPVAFGTHTAPSGWIWIFLLWISFGAPNYAQEIESAQEKYLSGTYAEVITMATAALKEKPAQPAWTLLLAQGLQQFGRTAEAKTALAKALERSPYDIQLRLAAFETLRATGAAAEASKVLADIDRSLLLRPGMFPKPKDRLAAGRLALWLGADPKQVLELSFDPIRKEYPEVREAFLFTAQLALEKEDFSLAAKSLLPACKKFPTDPDLWCALAQAYSQSDSVAMQAALQKALALNPNHLGAQLLLADQQIDAENYSEAEKILSAILKRNPEQSEAHAYQAVLAHLRGEAEAEQQARAKALKVWPTNPALPHLIGRKLSQKYRFKEGAAAQRQALAFAPQFVPAKAQLANDLLRLGQDEEGWKLAEEVQQADPYNVVAYNLGQLHEVLIKFRSLQSEHFTVRMDAQEAEIYGAETLTLLEQAHASLSKKYGLQLPERTIVEIFPNQKDFAIRTFGLPGGGGYLGVCFGRLITANSPSSRPEAPANWQAVLWHEFGHVVTLNLTQNKMPRWLSEGISVYEERQVRQTPGNPSGNWGEQMKPRYRAMILSEELSPVSALSAAFLKPKSPAHLGFAYYQSSLVVEWFIQRWGLEKLKLLLIELGKGTEINSALSKYFAPIDQLDHDFSEHARQLAKKTGPKLDWAPAQPADLASPEATTQFISAHPNNLTALNEQAARLIKAGQWQAAKAPLQKLIELYPNQHENESAYSQLARVYHELGDTAAEEAQWLKVANLCANATEALARLLTLAQARKEWPQTIELSARLAAINPLLPEVHRSAAQAFEAIDQRQKAIQAYQTLLRLQPADSPEIHFRLARLLTKTQPEEARYHLVLALEEAPRFRAAYRLLLELAEPPQPSAPPAQ